MRSCGYSAAGLLPLLLVLGATQTLNAAEYQGRVQAMRTLSLSTSESGRVAKVLVRPGQRVAKDELLLELDQRPYQARMRQLEARLKKTVEAVAEARRELDRTQEMYDRTLLSNHDLEVVKIAMTEAEAEHEAARAALQLSRLEREYSQIRAPRAARVESVLVQPGQTVVQRCEARPLIQITPVDMTLAVTQVNADIATAPQPGQAAKVSQGQSSWPAEVYSVTRLPLSDTGQAVQGYSLAVSFKPGDGERPGQSSQITIKLD